jgi:hypothetical protein
VVCNLYFVMETHFFNGGNRMSEFLQSVDLPMRRLSARGTRFQKYVFPTIWFSGLAVLFCVCVYQTLVAGNQDAAFGILVALFMGGAGFWFFKMLLLDLVDEVWDGDTELVVRNRGREARIPLTEIINVNYERMSNPPRVTLLLRNASEFGHEISFVVPAQMFSSPARRLALELIGRIDALREQQG